MQANQLDDAIEKIKAARSILLTTHRHSDGDGLGAQIALFHSLCLIGRSVRILNVDRPASKYRFLTDGVPIQSFDGPHDSLERTDLAIILDTNDSRLVEPLFTNLETKADQILFIDHHPRLSNSPETKSEFWIDTKSASTGELCYRLIRSLLAQFDRSMTTPIAAALYSSVVFDTQLFRFIRQSPASHLMAAALLELPFDVEAIHRALFATSSVQKLQFLSNAFNRIEYSEEGRIAFVFVNKNDLLGLPADDSGDLIDMMINIDSVEVAALLREEERGRYKISLRSKGRIEVLPLAEEMGGGGHPFAAGAYIEGEKAQLQTRILKGLRFHLGAES